MNNGVRESHAPRSGAYDGLETPSIGRRLASALYESLLLLGILFAAASLFLLASGAQPAQGTYLQALQIAYLGMVFAAYFLWCWLRSGQTLAMKAWRIRLIAAGRDKLPGTRALARFALVAFILCCAAAVLIFAIAQRNGWLFLSAFAIACLSPAWALVDRDNQFLHDRLAGTRLVLLPAPARRAGLRRRAESRPRQPSA